MGHARGQIWPTEVVAVAATLWRRASPPPVSTPVHGDYRTTDVVRSVAAARAFSLFELLIVLSLMGILTAIAVPRYARSIASYRAEAAARRVGADLMLAKAKARAASSPRTVTFNASAGTYTISGLRHLDNSTAPYTVDLRAAPYHATIEYADFGGSPQAQFDMYGTLAWDGKVVVRAGERAWTVSLARLDGSPTVE
jgi:prepilin-type N-terminal cleavage/methylation domain-containing protein